jgi:hypothetical protein
MLCHNAERWYAERRGAYLRAELILSFVVTDISAGEPAKEKGVCRHPGAQGRRGFGRVGSVQEEVRRASQRKLRSGQSGVTVMKPFSSLILRRNKLECLEHVFRTGQC